MRKPSYCGLLLLLACGAVPRSGIAVDIWMTSGNKSQLLRQQTDVIFQPGAGSGGTLINVNSLATYQTIAGFGAAMTDSSAWLIQNGLNGPAQDKLMRQLFSPTEGIGINYLRVPIGATDFTASGYYTYNDNPPGGSDQSQQHFSIAHDQAYIIPRLQEARVLNADLKLMASPWSAPAWMKTNNSLTGGSLLPQWESSYARYLGKFVQAYDDAGLPIDLITLQNEPLHVSNYPTMFMSPTQQANLIKHHVGPHFAAEGIDTKIVAYDHNWDDTAYPLAVLDDPDANQYVAGTAFHAYAGDPSAQTTVHNAHPDKGIYFTEISGGTWATNFSDNLVWNFENIFIGATRNWAKTALLWNLALDQNGKPFPAASSCCRGVVTINNPTGEITFNEEFYSLGQMTKAVLPGAVRINSTSNATLRTVAFMNPDGTRVLVALNPNTSTTNARIYEAGKHLNYAIPGKSVATFLWNDQGADFDNGGFDEGGYHLGGGSLDAWSVFGNVAGNVSTSDEVVLDGEKSLKLSGQLTGSVNASGVSQGISVNPGDEVIANLSALVESSDGLAGTSNIAELKIQYYREYGATFGSTDYLGEVALRLADELTATDTWHGRQILDTVPDNAAEARLVLQFLQPHNQSGSVFIDHVAFGLSDVVSLMGDYDANGVVDGADYLVWRDSFGSVVDLSADGNRNGIVDAADFTVWRDNQGLAVSARSVPEPAAITIALGGLFLFLAVRSIILPPDHGGRHRFGAFLAWRSDGSRYKKCSA